MTQTIEYLYIENNFVLFAKWRLSQYHTNDEETILNYKKNVKIKLKIR